MSRSSKWPLSLRFNDYNFELSLTFFRAACPTYLTVSGSLKEINCPQRFKKLSAFLGTRRFIAVLTKARH